MPARRKVLEMAIRKIEAMYHYFGCGTGHCADCEHLIRKVYDRTYYKCEVYGDSNSEATDWRKSWPACGLIGRTYPEDYRRVVEMIIPRREYPEVPGQVKMDFMEA